MPLVDSYTGRLVYDQQEMYEMERQRAYQQMSSQISRGLSGWDCALSNSTFTPPTKPTINSKLLLLTKPTK